MGFTEYFINSFFRVIENLFEVVRGPIPGTEPNGIAFSESAMFVSGADDSDFYQVIENLFPAFILVFCGVLVTAMENLLDNVSVDLGIMNHQCFEYIGPPICGNSAQQETAIRHFILSIGMGRNRN